jgi:uncharacterized membrane protein
MRLFGHPVHTMLLHFPVALWPAHWMLNVFASRLPAGVGAVAGFWVLLAGTALGWIAAFFGACDLLGVWLENDSKRIMAGIIHGSVNGGVLVGFTCLLAVEYPRYPSIGHGATFLSAEFLLLCAMTAGNYFGGSLVWGGVGDGRPRHQA